MRLSWGRELSNGRATRRRSADAIQYVALLGLIGLLALGAVVPNFTVPAWAVIGLISIAAGVNPHQFTSIVTGRRNNDQDEDG